MIIHTAGKRPEILDRVEKEGFVVFEEGDWNLNIIGERNPNGTPDKFDDWIHVIYKLRGIWNWHAFKCTTDAGVYYLKNYSIGRKGCAILYHPQQMRGAYKIDLHGGRYEALCQRSGKVKVWRDSNRDAVHDMDPTVETEEGYFGINIHRSSTRADGADLVRKYSAGCTVIQDPKDFKEFMWLCHQQKEKRGWDRFTYTLIIGL